MIWTGSFTSLGHYKLSGDPRGVWTLHHRQPSRTEPKGWFLYGPPGVDVIGEFMAERSAAAQRKALDYVTRYRPEDVVDAAKSAEHDRAWSALLESADVN